MSSERFASLSFGRRWVRGAVLSDVVGRGSVRLTETAREWGRRSTVVVPNWPSAIHVSTVQFKDYEVRR